MSLVKRDITPPSSVPVGSLAVRLDGARKWPISYDSVEPITILFDLTAIMLASLLSSAIYNLQVYGTHGDISKYFGAAIVASALFISLMRSRGMYKQAELLSLRNQIQTICVIWMSVFLLLATAGFALKIGSEFSRGAMISFAVSGLATLIAHRIAWRDILNRGLSQQRFSGRNIVLIMDRLQAGETSLPHVLASQGLRLARLFILPAPQPGSHRRQDIIDRAIIYIQGSDVDEIVVGADPYHWADLNSLVMDLRVLPLPVNLIPVGQTAEVFQKPSRVVGRSVSIELQRGPLTSLECTIKRCVDLFLAGAALLALSPLLLIVSIAIKLDSPGPVLFRQRRRGFNGRCFQIFKFRTMTVLEDGLFIPQAQSSDSRFTRLGRWLRRTSIDELPQLLNVLQGTMSLVGPRPHAVAHDMQFIKQVQNYALRHRVKPGLTGWAQVHGYRGPTDTQDAIERRVEYDLWYIDHWTLTLDLMIMLRTAIELLRGRNAY